MTSGTVNRIVALCLFFITLTIYLLTVAPTISFWDSAEFITCACTMGIPHPPGSPLLSLVGRVMSVIPFYDFRGGGFESIAYRLNLMGVLAGAFTVMLTYLIVVKLITRIAPFRRNALHDCVIMFSAAVAAFMAAFAHQFWVNSIETETYMPSLLVSMLAVWLALKWEERKDDPGALRYLLLAAYIVGLGNGIHLYALLIVPTVFIIVLMARPLWFADKKLWLILVSALAVIGLLRLAGGRGILYAVMGLLSLTGPCLILWLIRKASGQWMRTLLGLLLCLSLYSIGYSVYPTVVVRASKKPAVNEGNPDNWTRYMEYLDREQYDQGNMYLGMFTRNAGFGYQFGFMFVRYLFRQFPKWGPGINLTFSNNRSADVPGMEVAIKEKVCVSIGIWFIVLFGMYLHARGDTKKFTAFFLYFLLTSVGLVLYLNMQNPQARERDYFFLGAFQIIMIWVGFGVYGILNAVRKIAERWNKPALSLAATLIAGAVLAMMIPQAVLSNHLDPAYSNFKVHDRSRNWIPLDYGINMLDSCAPDAILFTNADNDTYPLWYAREVLGIRRDVRIVNLSILNGSWYIKQLRDEDVTVPITYTDDYIDNRLCGDNLLSGRTRTWSPEPDEVSIEGMTWKMPPSIVGTVAGKRVGILKVSNIMLYHILKENSWSRPVYFGVTVDPGAMIGLFEHMSIEGMVFRLVRKKAPPDMYNINAPVLDRNIYEKYSYRGITDSTVYKSPDTVKLLANYSMAFIRLCEKYIELGDHENAIRAARGVFEQTGPDLDRRILLYSILWNGGIKDEYERMMEREINNLPLDDPVASAKVCMRFVQLSMYEPALDIFRPVVEKYPGNTDILKGYISALYGAGMYEEALRVNDRLIAVSPGDPDVHRTRDIIRMKLESTTRQ